MAPEDAERLGKVQLRLARHSFNPVDPAEWEHINDVRADLWWAADLLRRQDATIIRLREDRTKLSIYAGNVEHDRDRLRGLLARLEWAGETDERACCPVCFVLADSPVVGQQPHLSDCWLAGELGRARQGSG